MSSFGKRLRAFRGLRGLSRRALERRTAELGVRVSEHAIEAYETGERKVPGYDRVVILAAALDVPVQDLGSGSTLLR